MPADMTGKIRTSLIMSHELSDGLQLLADREERSKHSLVIRAVKKMLREEGINVPAPTPRKRVRKKA